MRPTTILGDALSPSINSASVPELSVAIAIASVLLAIQWISPFTRSRLAPAMALLGRMAYVLDHDPAPSSGRPRRPRFSHRRLVVCLPRVLSIDPTGSEVQLSHGPPADGRGAPVRDQSAAVHPRWGRRFQADPSRHDLRQDGELVPARHLSAI